MLSFTSSLAFSFLKIWSLSQTLSCCVFIFLSQCISLSCVFSNSHFHSHSLSFCLPLFVILSFILPLSPLSLYPKTVVLSYLAFSFFNFLSLSLPISHFEFVFLSQCISLFLTLSLTHTLIHILSLSVFFYSFFHLSSSLSLSLILILILHNNIL